MLSFHFYLVDYFIKEILLLFESNYFYFIIIIIIVIHVHSVDRVDTVEAQFVSKLGSSLGSGWLQEVITASNGRDYSLLSKNIGNEEK